MASKLLARQKRFWHCLFYVVACQFQHRMMDLYDYPKLPTRFLFGLRGRHVEMGCECGKVFWKRS